MCRRSGPILFLFIGHRKQGIGILIRAMAFSLGTFVKQGNGLGTGEFFSLMMVRKGTDT